ncbi:MAG TPA: site-specific integrase, partial [Bacteroidales bacterium]
MDYVLSFLNYLEFEKRYSRHTVESYQTDLRQFEQYCTEAVGSELVLIDAKAVRSWVVSLLENKCGNRSVNR